MSFCGKDIAIYVVDDCGPCWTNSGVAFAAGGAALVLGVDIA